MLGDKLGEEKGKLTGQRVLPSSGGPSVESSFQASGAILGVKYTTLGTYVAAMRPNGTLLGEGQGVVMTEDGGAATWKGSGVGKLGVGGSVAYRGALYYETAHPKWSTLNGIAAVYEYEVDAEGNTMGQIWEWK